MTTWQVLDGSGGVRDVPVRMEGGRLLVGAGPGPRVWDATVPPRLAVASLAVSMGWPVREILSPKDASQASRLSLLGELLAVIHRDGGHYLAQHGAEHACGEAVRCVLSDREALAAMTAERDDARRAATLAEAERDTLRGLVDGMREENERLRADIAARDAVADEAVAPVTAEVLAAHDRPLVGSEHARTLAVTLAWPEAEVAALIVGLPLAVDDVGSELAVRVRWARRRGELTLTYREHAGVMDALRRRSTGLATGEGVAAAPLDPVDALNAAVTAAIFRAERLTREGSPDATAAYADVARYEAALAALHPADTVEGETAREGVALATGAAAVVLAAEGAER